MTKKEYNALVNECKSSSCYHCGFSQICSQIKEIPSPFIRSYRDLSEHEKESLSDIKTQGGNEK